MTTQLTTVTDNCNNTDIMVTNNCNHKCNYNYNTDTKMTDNCNYNTDTKVTDSCNYNTDTKVTKEWTTQNGYR